MNVATENKMSFTKAKQEIIDSAVKSGWQLTIQNEDSVFLKKDKRQYQIYHLGMLNATVSRADVQILIRSHAEMKSILGLNK